MRLHSQILISNDLEGTILALESAVTTERIVKIIEGEKAFSVDDARLVIEKAYMASEETTVIILAAKIFTPIVQNKLLKVIEEPPAKKEFILVTPSKATILSTIRSRLPIVVLNEERTEADLGLDLPQLSLATVYEFIQSHKRTDAKAMKLLIESISKEAIRSQQYDLDEKTLILFSNAFIALDVGSPSQFVLTTLLLKLLARKKR
ncbi:DNA polymerase III subunit delta' [Sulfurovum lithotrophicum]|uniref:DNA polymerase III subunit delta n=1 Tax=Sulfurovum lithotrophicum TaxID=206403 RepID=A0A7U4RR69_9BACT|nr:DNA polymerase III subunit delta' [Sulfurovum lithotrophicum]AKF25481.1 DNA polymerase III subunit delta' [Sulfurovum lithotrophicum]